MQADPYNLCICGSGKKTKWCCAKIFPDVERIQAFLSNNQAESALAKAEQLVASNPTLPYAHSVKARVLKRLGRFDEAMQYLDEAIERFPDAAILYDARGEIFLEIENVPAAKDALLDAVARYPATATDHLSIAFLRLAVCSVTERKPLAAWANLKRALRFRPENDGAQQMLAETFQDNPFFPNQMRQGLKLKPPDELALFNEERSAKWSATLRHEDQLDVDDLVADFEYLAKDDPHDLAAWYNFAIAAAWRGDNRKALEAIDHYVRYEDDFDAAADMWDLAEIIRAAPELLEVCDSTTNIATYSCGEIGPVMETLRACRQVVFAKVEDALTVMWLNRELPPPHQDVPILGGPIRPIAYIGASENGIHVIATSARLLHKATADFEKALGELVQKVEEVVLPGNTGKDDVDICRVITQAAVDEKEFEALKARSASDYFENEWIHDPLKSLDGAAPIDAAQNAVLRKKLEGVIRYRARSFGLTGVPYNFDRLRMKLGLAPHESVPPDAPTKTDYSAASIAQLSSLDPGDLDDDDLIAAYRGAASHDAPATMERLAEELSRRDGAAGKLNLASIFVDLAKRASSDKDWDRAAHWIETGVAHDQKHYGGKNEPLFDACRGMLALAKGDTDEAASLYRQACERDRNNLDTIAKAAEQLLRGGAYVAALEFAERGLRQAEATRSRSHQAQFKEYVAEAGARAAKMGSAAR